MNNESTWLTRLRIFFNCNILIFFIYAVPQFPRWNSKEPVGSERLSMRSVKLSQHIEDAGY